MHRALLLLLCSLCVALTAPSLGVRQSYPSLAARGASPSMRLAARQASPSKRLTARQSAVSPRYAAPAPAKRFPKDMAPPLRRTIDDQRSQSQFCLDGLMPCPVLSTPGRYPLTFSEWEAVGFECVDHTADLRSCGGCSSLDPSQHDCTSIPHVSGVACVAGICQISSCQPGYALQSDGQGCSPMN